VVTAVRAEPLAERRRLRLGAATKQAAFGYAILLPTLAILFIFRFLPMIEAFVISFSKYDLIHPARYVGFANFVDLVQDPLFRNSARISLTYVVFSVLPVWPLSLGLAVLFNRSLLLKNVLRSAVFMPVVMPAVVMAVVWTFMYQQDGVLNTALGWLGIDPIPWLRSSSTALPNSSPSRSARPCSARTSDPMTARAKLRSSDGFSTIFNSEEQDRLSHFNVLCRKHFSVIPA